MLSRVPNLITHIDKNLEHAPVHQRRDQPRAVVRGQGRHAGQRHLVEQPGLRHEHVAADHLRRRRQRRLRRDEPDVAVQRVHERLQRLELQERRPDQVGDHLGADRQQRRGGRRSTGRRSPIRTRRPGRTRSSRAPSTSGGPGPSGPGTPGAVPQDKNPNIAFYEANCPEFTVFGGDPNCGDYQPMGGGPQSIERAGDLTGTTYGSDRTGGSISWIARNRADHGTLWAATSAGRIFVTHNADATDPATVVWHRVDNADARRRGSRAPSTRTVKDTGHAWVTYSGYNAATPTTPGHVFSVNENGSAPGSGKFTNLERRERDERLPDADRRRRPAGERRRPRRPERQALRLDRLRRALGRAATARATGT